MSFAAKLITPSLLNSFNWLQNCPPSWREKALADITRYLNRAPFEPNDSMKLGQDFENQVRKLSQGMKVEGIMPTAVEMANLVKGGSWQVKLKGYIIVDEVRYCLYGRIDVLTKEILDIKTTSDYKGEDKYLSTAQHLIYLYNAHSCNWAHDTFKYLVTDFKEIHEVKFQVADWDLLNVEVHRKVKEFADWLNKNPELKDAYNNTFCY